MSNFGSLSYFQTSLLLGVQQGLQKLPKFDINDLRLSFHCNILIPRKCLRKTLFKAQCHPPGFSDLSTALQRAPLPLLCNESIQFTTGQLYRHKESFCCGDGVGLVSLFTHTEGEIMIHDAKKISTPSRRSIKV